MRKSKPRPRSKRAAKPERKLPVTNETPLKICRCKRNLPQSAVAKDLGCSQAWYSKIERGATLPDVHFASVIADYFGVTVSSLWPMPDSSARRAAA